MKKLLLFGTLSMIGFGSYLAMMSVRAQEPRVSNLSKEDYANGTKRAADAAKRVTPRLEKEMKGKNMRPGNAVYIRVFKESREMELWVQKTGQRDFALFKTYKVAAMSGVLGPKLKEGDRQAPEGFYYVNRGRMNPVSRFHLAFNIGYPNRYDQKYGRTGSALMVHGNQVSVGCFAMTDHYVEEIYTLCDAALNRGQKFFRVHSFPFRMTEQRMAKAKSEGSQWYGFWENLREGYHAFEQTHIPPNVNVVNKRYTFN